MKLTLAVVSKSGQVRAECSAEDEAILVFDGLYELGDIITLEASGSPIPQDASPYVVVQLDDAMCPAFCFLRGGKASFAVPFGENRVSYSPLCFTGNRHYLSARTARPEEIAVRKNVAFNPYDSHENCSLFPHASANVETRGEAVFAARNAIDGYLADTFHGEWPYSSWGINKDPAAELLLDFGRGIIIDEIVLYLRADFPHDAWWRQVSVSFSDGSTLVLPLLKTGGAQRFPFEKRRISSLTLKELIKADDPSPFPALTQIQVFGTEVPQNY